jgi:hypothetical protein
VERDGGYSALVRAQGSDGGWGYHPGSSSWTEPTALAVLALRETIGARDAVARGCDWLIRSQRPDGGWPPCPAVNQSTWVTSFAAIALAGSRTPAVIERAGAWLLNHRGRGSGALDRLRCWLVRDPCDPTPSGWSWYPETASWVIPTAVSLLALNKISIDLTLAGSTLAKRRITDGQGFLFARECPAGGWNHGGTFVRSENAQPYPETTGLALLALRGTSGANAARLSISLARAHQMLRSPQSAQGSAWLRMGLAACEPNAAPPLSNVRSRNWTTVDVALDVISALSTNPLLS